MDKSKDCKEETKSQKNKTINSILEDINNAPSKITLPIENLKNLLCKNVVEFLINFSTQISSDFILFGEDKNSLDPWSETYVIDNNVVDAKDFWTENEYQSSWGLSLKENKYQKNNLLSKNIILFSLKKNGVEVYSNIKRNREIFTSRDTLDKSGLSRNLKWCDFRRIINPYDSNHIINNPFVNYNIIIAICLIISRHYFKYNEEKFVHRKEAIKIINKQQKNIIKQIYKIINKSGFEFDS